MTALLNDLRYAFRNFAKNPVFTAAVILSLAIGIGANTSIFSITYALLLRPLPYKNADRLVILWNRSPGLNITQDWFSPAQYFDIKNGHSGFEQVAIAIGGNFNLTGSGDPERVGAIRVSSNLLPMLGVNAAAGRLFTPEEDSPGRQLTAVLTYGFWSQHFGSDPNMLGKPLIINGVTYEVAGILPKYFSLPREVLPILYGTDHADLFIPLPFGADAPQHRQNEDYNILGTLKPSVTVAQAQAEMDTLTARLRRDHPDVYPPNGGLTFGIVPLLDQVVGDARRPLLILLGSVGFVLLIACANVANLQLSRAVARQKEIAIRTALGASRGRVIRQLLTESISLALCGGALGVLFSFWAVKWIHVLGPKSVPRLYDIGVNSEALLFTFLLSIISGALFGLAPALRLGRLDIHATLKDESRGSAGSDAVWGRGNNLRRLLVVSELALSVVLLIGAGLLIRSFARLQNVQPGFNPKNVLTLELTMTGKKYADRNAVLNTYHDLWDRLERLPGVTAAGGVTPIPLSATFAWGPIVIEGRTPLPGENFINADERVVAGHYFQAMEIPLLKGRLFDDHDNATAPFVAVIDEYMAQQFWPNENPLGKHFRHGTLTASGQPIEIVGVVGRIKQYTLDADSRIALYMPQTQNPSRGMDVVLRSTGDPAALTSAVKDQLRAIDPDLPMYGVRTMAQRVDESLASRRFSMLLLGLFASLALALAAIGTYGVMAYLVNQATREIGIRMALGATQQNILSLILRKGLTLTLSGVALGLAAAFALTQLLRSQLFGIKATDPATFFAIAILLAGIALFASYIPARRAARIDPMISLRSE
ncbi:MAG TPA: ABC transporter permease [Candidatus Acidoferrales bacterium]|nr:ABC transporter permease [Candidatus Acidoferrales bacterium]